MTPRCALVVTVNADATVASMYGFLVILGAGSGLYRLAGLPVTQAPMPAEEISYAVGFQAVAQVLGPTVFLSACDSIFHNPAMKLSPHCC
ncbi:hypothetical protein F4802DRAFT_68989 [Xylaria palmicola]|nr:hypothetical protein F4802DRAFT_68989 [Xylaria palmicola]